MSDNRNGYRKSGALAIPARPFSDEIDGDMPLWSPSFRRR
jgi:hypothetical protein